MRRILVGTIIIIAVFLLGGCWDNRQLEEISVPIAAGYDLQTPAGGKYHKRITVTTIVPVFQRQSEKKYYIDEVGGINVGQTRGLRAYHIGRPYMPVSNQVILAGKSLARAGLVEPFDALLRSPQISNTMYVAVVDGKASDAMHIKTERYPNPAFFMLELLHEINKQTFQVNPNLHNFTYNMLNPGLQPVAPTIRIHGDHLDVSGTAIFDDGHMVGQVGIHESQILTLLRGWKCNGFLSGIIYQNGKPTDQVTVNCSNQRKVKLRCVGGEYYFDIKIILKGVLVDRVRTAKAVDDTKLNMIEKALENKTKSECDAFIHKMRNNFKVDCIDITKYALAKRRSELIQTDFSKLLQHYHFNVDVELTIRNTGETT